MLLSLLQNKVIDLHLTKAAVCLTMTEIVGKDDFHDRRTDSHHHILPDKSDIAARITCSHSLLTAAVDILSKVVSLLCGENNVQSLFIDSSCRHPFEGRFTAVWLKRGRLLGNGSGTCAAHFVSSSSKKLLY